MKLHFQGANRQVTGSRYCLECGDQLVMVDCGMFQERQYSARNWHPFQFDPSLITTLLVTHAHIDHCGLIPRLVAQGFSGSIIATRATAELLGVMLRDAAKIQAEDAAYKAKRHRRDPQKRRFAPEPLFTPEDAERAIDLIEGVRFRTWTPIADQIRLQFHDAGHILGSASLEVEATEGDMTRTILFSGDVGQWDKPLIRDPALLTRADYVVLESTYGDRDHRDEGDIGEKLGEVIKRTVRRGGKVIIPTFAVERAQELMYHISRLVHDDQLPAMPIYLDSPMAVDVTEIFQRHRDNFDEETWQLIHLGEPPLKFRGLHFSRSTEDSQAINRVRGPAIIMSTSGMCTAGRIKHHLRQHIEDKKNTILFVGYQAHGTLGRSILEGNDTVRIHGRNYKVKAEVDRIYGFSAHGDRSDLLRWLGELEAPPRRIYLTHGDEDAALSLALCIRERLKFPVSVPHYGSMYDLA